MKKGYVADNWKSGIDLADGYLEAFIERYRTKNPVGIFLLGHSIELYVKSLYWKFYGVPRDKNTHNITKILEDIADNNKAINIILNDIKSALPLSQVDLIYNGNLADLKYLNMTHNKLEKLNFNQYVVEFEQSRIFFKHLSIIFHLLERDESDCIRLLNIIKELDVKIKNNQQVYIADMEIICFLKMILIPNYKPMVHKTIFGDIYY